MDLIVQRLLPVSKAHPSLDLKSNIPVPSAGSPLAGPPVIIELTDSSLTLSILAVWGKLSRKL
jgi:hypothetical protein